MVLLTGQKGQSVQFYAEDAYKIERVIFGAVDCPKFSSVPVGLSRDLVTCLVPDGATYGKVQLISNVRGVTGYSLSNFIPVPIITGMSPTSGKAGGRVDLLGIGFSGVTGVSFNNIEVGHPTTGQGFVTNYTGIDGMSKNPQYLFTGFSVDSDNVIRAEIPSGNTKGFVKVHQRSGVTSSLSIKFGPEVVISGFSPASGRRGTEVMIVGENFDPNLMQQVDSNKYLVSFYRGATGQFQRVDGNRLSGVVPLRASQGPVKIAENYATLYKSSKDYTPVEEPPIIDSMNPLTGKVGTWVDIRGENFLNVEQVGLTGSSLFNGFYGATGRYAEVGDFRVMNQGSIRFKVPMTPNGRYNPLVRTSAGYVTGDNQSGTFFHVLKPGVVSGFSPTSGMVNTLVRASGKFLYPVELRVFVCDQNHTYDPTKKPEGQDGITECLDVSLAPGSTSSSNVAVDAKFSGIQFRIPSTKSDLVLDYDIIIDNSVNVVNTKSLSSNWPVNETVFSLIGSPRISGDPIPTSGIAGETTVSITGSNFFGIKNVFCSVGNQSRGVTNLKVTKNSGALRVVKPINYERSVLESIATGLLESKTFHTAHSDPKIIADGFQNGGEFHLDYTYYGNTTPGSGGAQYTINGINRPVLFLTADRTYDFKLGGNDFTNYPFYISTSPTGGTGSAGQGFAFEITTSEVSGSGTAGSAGYNSSSRGQGCYQGSVGCTDTVKFTPSSGRIGTILYYHNGHSGGTGAPGVGPGAGAPIIITGETTTLVADVMTFQLPSGCPEGVGSLRVEASGGNATVPFTFINQAAKAIKCIPTSGYYDDTVVVSGVKLNGINDILFSGENGTSEIAAPQYSTIGTTGIKIKVPRKTDDGKIKLHHASDGYIFLEDSFDVLHRPEIKSIEPNHGFISDTIQVSGVDLSGAGLFFYGYTGGITTPLTTTYKSTTGVYVTVPRNVANGPLFFVQETAGEFYTGASEELFKPIPLISGFTPKEMTTGEFISVTGVNAIESNIYETIGISGFNLKTKTTGVFLIDGNNPLLIDSSTITGTAGSVSSQNPPPSGHSTPSQYTKITGKIDDDFVGSGYIFLINSLDNMLVSQQVAGSFTTISGGLDKAVSKPFASSTKHEIIKIKPSPPEITSISPTSGSVNTTITLLGDNLDTITGLAYIDPSGGAQAILNYTGFNTVNKTGIIFNPIDNDAPARTGYFKVGDPFNISNPSVKFKFIPIPIISGFNPTRASAGEPVTVTGKYFETITGVSFVSTGHANVIAEYTVVTQGQLTVTVPTEGRLPAPQKASIRISNVAGSAIKGAFTAQEGTKRIFGDLTVSGAINASGGLNVVGATSPIKVGGGGATISGATNLIGRTHHTGPTTLEGFNVLQGDTSVSGTLRVTGSDAADYAMEVRDGNLNLRGDLYQSGEKVSFGSTNTDINVGALIPSLTTGASGVVNYGAYAADTAFNFGTATLALPDNSYKWSWVKVFATTANLEDEIHISVKCGTTGLWANQRYGGDIAPGWVGHARQSASGGIHNMGHPALDGWAEGMPKDYLANRTSLPLTVYLTQETAQTAGRGNVDGVEGQYRQLYAVGHYEKKDLKTTVTVTNRKFGNVSITNSGTTNIHNTGNLTIHPTKGFAFLLSGANQNINFTGDAAYVTGGAHTFNITSDNALVSVTGGVNTVTGSKVFITGGVNTITSQGAVNITGNSVTISSNTSGTIYVTGHSSTITNAFGGKIYSSGNISNFYNTSGSVYITGNSTTISTIAAGGNANITGAALTVTTNNGTIVNQSAAHTYVTGGNNVFNVSGNSDIYITGSTNTRITGASGSVMNINITGGASTFEKLNSGVRVNITGNPTIEQSNAIVNISGNPTIMSNSDVINMTGLNMYVTTNGGKIYFSGKSSTITNQNLAYVTGHDITITNNAAGRLYFTGRDATITNGTNSITGRTISIAGTSTNSVYNQAGGTTTFSNTVSSPTFYNSGTLTVTNGNNVTNNIASNLGTLNVTAENVSGSTYNISGSRIAHLLITGVTAGSAVNISGHNMSFSGGAHNISGGGRAVQNWYFTGGNHALTAIAGDAGAEGTAGSVNVFMTGVGNILYMSGKAESSVDSATTQFLAYVSGTDTVINNAGGITHVTGQHIQITGGNIRVTGASISVTGNVINAITQGGTSIFNAPALGPINITGQGNSKVYVSGNKIDIRGGTVYITGAHTGINYNRPLINITGVTTTIQTIAHSDIKFVTGHNITFRNVVNNSNDSNPYMINCTGETFNIYTSSGVMISGYGAHEKLDVTVNEGSTTIHGQQMSGFIRITGGVNTINAIMDTSADAADAYGGGGNVSIYSKIMITGGSTTLYLSSGTDASKVSVTGQIINVNITGDGAKGFITGTGVWVDVNQGGTLNITGSNATVATSSGTINITGHSTTVTTSNGTINITGLNNTITTSNGTVRMTGVNTVTTASQKVYITGGNNTVTTANNVVNITGYSTTISSSAGNVNITGYTSTVTNANGGKIVISGSSSTLTNANGGDIWVSGKSSTITNANGGSIYVTGNSSTLTNNNGGTINITGHSTTITESAGSINITGKTNTITTASGVINLTGTNTVTTANGRVIMTGTNTVTNATSTVYVSGTNTITAAGSSKVYVTGHSNTVSSNASKIWMSGATATVTNANGGDVFITGSASTITNANGGRIFVTGNTSTVTNSNGTLYFSGYSATITNGTNNLTGNTFTVNNGTNTVNIGNGGRISQITGQTITVNSNNGGTVYVTGHTSTINNANGGNVHVTGHTVTVSLNTGYTFITGHTANIYNSGHVSATGARIIVNNAGGTTTVSVPSGFGDITSQSHKGDGSTRDYWLDMPGGSVQNLMVSVGGLTLLPTEYSLINGGTGIRLGTAPADEVPIEVRNLKGSTSVNITGGVNTIHNSGRLWITGSATVNNEGGVANITGSSFTLNSGIANFTGQTVTVSAASACNITTNGRTFVTGNTFNITNSSNAELYITGNNTTVTSNNGTMNITGYSTTITESAGSINITGHTNTITHASGVINVSGGTTTITNANDKVVMTGTNTVTNANGTVYASGINTITTASNRVSMSGVNTITTANGTVLVTGHANTITNNAGKAWISGSTSTVTTNADGGVIYLTGASQTITSNAGKIYITGNTSTITTNAANGDVFITGKTTNVTTNNGNISISGNTANITTVAAGGHVYITGKANTITTNNGVMHVSGYSNTIANSGTIHMSGQTNTVSTSNGPLYISGANTVTTSHGAVHMSGVSTITTSNGDIYATGANLSIDTVANGAKAYITGTSSTISSNAGTVYATGNTTNITNNNGGQVYATGLTTNITTNNGTVRISGLTSTITTVANGGKVYMSGATNTVTTNNGTMYVSGYSNTLYNSGVAHVTGQVITIASSTGPMTLSGNANTVTTAAGLVRMSGINTITTATSTVYMTGNSNTITTANGDVLITGNSNTITSNAGKVWMSGKSSTVTNANGGDIYLTGNTSTVTNANGGRIFITGHTATLATAQGTVNITGNQNTITTASATVNISGGTNTVTTANGKVVMTGGANTVTTANGTVYASGINTITTASNRVSMSGINTITTANSTVLVTGHANTVSSNAGKVWMSGATSTVTNANGGKIYLTGNSSTITNSNGTIYITGYSASVSNGTNNLTGYSFTVENGTNTINVGDGGLAVVTGNTISFADNNGTVYVTGHSATVTNGTNSLTGYKFSVINGTNTLTSLGGTNPVTISGGTTTITTSNGNAHITGNAITISSNAGKAYFTGNSATITNGTNSLTGYKFSVINGTNTLTSLGGSNPVTISGGTNTVTTANDRVLITGGSTTITTASANTHITGNAITISSNVGKAYFTGNSATITNGTNSLTGYKFSVINGTNTLTSLGGTNPVTISGGTTTITTANGDAHITGNAITISSNAGKAYFTGNSATITNANGGDIFVTGHTSTITNANGGRIFVTGHTATIATAQGTLNITGYNNTVTTAQGTVNASGVNTITTAAGTVNASGVNTVTTAQGTVNMSGVNTVTTASSTVAMSGINTVTTASEKVYITGNVNTVTTANGSVYITGGANTITTASANTHITGNAITISSNVGKAYFTGNSATVTNGTNYLTGNTFSVTNGTNTIHNISTAHVSGSAITISSNVGTINLTGNSSTITNSNGGSIHVTGNSSSITNNGTIHVTGYTATITNGVNNMTGVTFTINNGTNTFSGAAGSRTFATGHTFNMPENKGTINVTGRDITITSGNVNVTNIQSGSVFTIRSGSNTIQNARDGSVVNITGDTRIVTNNTKIFATGYQTTVTTNGGHLFFTGYQATIERNYGSIYITGNRATFNGANNGTIYVSGAGTSAYFSGDGTIGVNKLILDYDNLPTSDPTQKGQVWRNGTDLKVSAG